MHFSPSYMKLRRWVHTPTLESDAHLLPPRDFHADNSRLVQILRDGHYMVRLDKEAWDRLITWIDLNAPFHGSWQEVVAADPVKLAAARHGATRRREMNRRYAGMDEDPDAIGDVAVLEKKTYSSFQALSFAEDAPKAVPPIRDDIEMTAVEIAPGVTLELVRIEPGTIVIRTFNAYPNERKFYSLTIEEPFLMGRFEITNEQYRCFDPDHDSGLVTGEAYQFGDNERGFTLNRPEQPVVRVSWEQAMRFCEWLSDRTGMRFSLPTEEQWEYACRAGTATQLWYGTVDCDFSPYANFSDATHYTVHYPHVPNAHPPWRPADTRFDDTWRVAAPVGSFKANPWGLHDMHGNVAEWTRSKYAALQFCGTQGLTQASDQRERDGSVPVLQFCGTQGLTQASDQRERDGSVPVSTRKVVRGGSWLDLPRRGRSAFRLHYEASQAVFDVGFRVVCDVFQTLANNKEAVPETKE